MMKQVFLLISILLLACSAKSKIAKTDNEDIYSRIKQGKPVYVVNQTFENEIDFTSLGDYNFVEKSNYEQSFISSSVTFVNCTFKKNVYGFNNLENNSIKTCIFDKNLTFTNCTFEKDFIFDNCEIRGKIDLSESNFSGLFSMQNLTAQQEVYFKKSYFFNESRFHNSFFHRKVNITEAIFEKTTSFQGCTFVGELHSFSTKFYGYFDFSQTDVRGRAFFTHADFRTKSDFSNSVYHGMMDFVSANLNDSNFDNARFLDLFNFDKSIKNKPISFKNSIFLLKENSKF